MGFRKMAEAMRLLEGKPLPVDINSENRQRHRNHMRCLAILVAGLTGERGNNDINNEMVVSHAVALLLEMIDQWPEPKGVR